MLRFRFQVRAAAVGGGFCDQEQVLCVGLQAPELSAEVHLALVLELLEDDAALLQCDFGV